MSWSRPPRDVAHLVLRAAFGGAVSGDIVPYRGLFYTNRAWRKALVTYLMDGGARDVLAYRMTHNYKSNFFRYTTDLAWDKESIEAACAQAPAERLVFAFLMEAYCQHLLAQCKAHDAFVTDARGVVERARDKAMRYAQDIAAKRWAVGRRKAERGADDEEWTRKRHAIAVADCAKVETRTNLESMLAEQRRRRAQRDATLHRLFSIWWGQRSYMGSLYDVVHLDERLNDYDAKRAKIVAESDAAYKALAACMAKFEALDTEYARPLHLRKRLRNE